MPRSAAPSFPPATRLRIALALALGAGCQPLGPRAGRVGDAVPSSAGARPPPASGGVAGARTCDSSLPLYDTGRAVRQICLDEAARTGLTVVDLSDEWLPYLFSEDDGLGERGRQSYRERLLALASERFGRGPEWEVVRDDRFLELFGVSPSLSVLRRRLGEADRHRCHARIDDAPLRSTGASRRRPPPAAVRVAQEHLLCEGLLGRHRPGSLDEVTAAALARYQRRHAIIPDLPLDSETRRALLTESRELDFLAALRALRERVADATGLIEDGSAAARPGQVLGRTLDSTGLPSLRPMGEALPGAAPDLLSAATEAAALALGWIGPDEFAAAPRPGHVALRLPPEPAYHSGSMDLRAVIDRGDVWYDYPFGRGARAPRSFERRPVLVLYARAAGREVPLVRWPTTIGGWQVERLPSGDLAYRYKNSDTGPRAWRDIIAAPAWLPPPGIPEKELVRRGAGGWRARDEVVGPGYRSAYGLVMLMLHSPIAGPGGEAGEPVYEDSTLRVHGSANYESVLRGNSHGCHRLYNQLAIRLAGFLLQHRSFVRHGDLRAGFARRMYWRDQTLSLHVTSRGYRYELAPPVPVEVLPGRIRGPAQAPILRPMPVPRDVVARYRRW